MEEFWEDVRYILDSKLFSRISPFGLKVLRVIFLGITVTFLVICVGYGVRYSQFVTIDGTVLEKETEYGHGTSRAYFATIGYEYEGNNYVTTQNVSLHSTMYNRGEKCTLKINPKHPEEVKFSGNTMKYGIFSAVSLIVFLYLSHVSDVHRKAIENHKIQSSVKSYVKSDCEVDERTEKHYDPTDFYGGDSRL